MLTIKAIASGSSGNAYLLDDGAEHQLLLECGIPFAKLIKALRFDISKLSGCLVTHEHKDHSHAIADVLRYGIDVYCSGGTAEACKVVGHHNLHVVTVKKPVVLPGFSVLPLRAEHDAAEPLLYLIRGSGFLLLFATDTYYIRYKMPEDLTHIMIECNYSMERLNENINGGEIDSARKQRILHSHMNLNTLREFIKANEFKRLEQIYLIHLSRENSDADAFVREIEMVTGVPVTAV
jgi:phosphoribosyl 1,2-cyclic phosphodiesterase|nr:MAG TPA: YycJ-like MBL-fold protein [Caudoviricetes sp.]